MGKNCATTGAFLIDTVDVEEAEAAVTRNFGRVRITAPHDNPSTRTSVWRQTVGPLILDEVRYDYGMQFAMDPLEQILLCRLHNGTLEECVAGGTSHTVGPGGVVALGGVEGASFSGGVDRAVYDMVVLDRSVFDAVAPRPAKRNRSVRLTSTEPVSPKASRMIADAVDYVRRSVD